MFDSFTNLLFHHRWAAIIEPSLIGLFYNTNHNTNNVVSSGFTLYTIINMKNMICLLTFFWRLGAS